MVESGIDWTTVLVAFVASLPALVAAVAAVRVHRQIRTPSGDYIGAVVERTHEVGIANHMILRKQNGGHDEPKGEASAEQAGI